MEAIAAAGALPGLASATIQLGTATFQFYQQLHSLYKAIKHGEDDLSTAVKRLDQHEDFIKELRFHFKRISEPGVSASTRDLFERYITDSEAEVEEFRTLLDRVGKQHFKGKSWQAVETGSRLRFHERSIQKYCDLLDKQMQRFLFLQSSVHSMRVESTLAEVKETLVEQGAKAVAFYDEHSSKEVSDLRLQLRARSSEKQLPSRRARKSYCTTPSLQQDVIPTQWHTVRRDEYHTLCGTITVTEFSDRGSLDTEDYQFAYKVQFEPYNWISRTLVEWRCLINSTLRAPTLVLSMTAGIICEDPDVIDALGLITCGRPRWSSRWSRRLGHPRIPNLSKVKALLDAGRLLKEYVVNETDILSACFDFLATYGCGLGTSWDSAELLRYYREFYDVVELLLSRGFEPTFSSWQNIYHQAVQYRHRISQERLELVRTMDMDYQSIYSLILKNCGYSIPVDISATFAEQLRISSQQLLNVGASPFGWHWIQLNSCDSSSHVGYLIALKFPVELIRRAIPELDLLDLADEQHTLDRWLLGLFAPHRPEIALLLQQCLKSYKSTATRNQFKIEYIREEFKQWDRRSNTEWRRDLLEFLCFHGNAVILQQLDIAALYPMEIEHMLEYASQGSANEIFDILISHVQSTPKFPQFMLLHTNLMRERLASDPVFLGKFIASLAKSREAALLSTLFQEHLSCSLLLATDSHPLPAYIQNFIIGLVQRYETHSISTECAIYSLVYSAMSHHWRASKSAEYLLLPLHLYRILGLVARSSAFKSSLDISGPKYVLPFWRTSRYEIKAFPYPSVNKFSALMLALHCGMKPAAQILIDAGASILTPICCGKSALSVAYENIRAQHPRKWAARYGWTCESTILEFDGTECYSRPRNHEALWVSESTDNEMLEILLKALRDRGEVVEEELDELRTSSKWEMLKGKARYFAYWLFKPSYVFDPDTFRENGIYVILVSTLYFLSVLKVLRVEFGDCPSRVANLLSRPVVALALVVLVLSIIR